MKPSRGSLLAVLFWFMVSCHLISQVRTEVRAWMVGDGFEISNLELRFSGHHQVWPPRREFPSYHGLIDDPSSAINCPPRAGQWRWGGSAIVTRCDSGVIGLCHQLGTEAWDTGADVIVDCGVATSARGTIRDDYSIQRTNHDVFFISTLHQTTPRLASIYELTRTPKGVLRMRHILSEQSTSFLRPHAIDDQLFFVDAAKAEVRVVSLSRPHRCNDWQRFSLRKSVVLKEGPRATSLGELTWKISGFRSTWSEDSLSLVEIQGVVTREKLFPFYEGEAREFWTRITSIDTPSASARFWSPRLRPDVRHFQKIVLRRSDESGEIEAFFSTPQQITIRTHHNDPANFVEVRGPAGSRYRVFVERRESGFRSFAFLTETRQLESDGWELVGLSSRIDLTGGAEVSAIDEGVVGVGYAKRWWPTNSLEFLVPTIFSQSNSEITIDTRGLSTKTRFLGSVGRLTHEFKIVERAKTTARLKVPRVFDDSLYYDHRSQPSTIKIWARDPVDDVETSRTSWARAWAARRKNLHSKRSR